MLDLEFAELSDCGRVREQNEDCVGHVVPMTAAQVQSQGWLFAVADGIGGHEQGEVASRLAIDTTLAGFRKIPKGVMHASLLPRLVQEANAAVYDAGRGKPATRRASRMPMGSTLVVCALRFDSAVIAHVGDSRCYLFRDRLGRALTRDHTLAEEQFRLGMHKPSNERANDSRHVLTRSLGNDLFVAADTITVNIMPKDILLLCSDGLHGYVPDEQILELVYGSPDLSYAAANLVHTANEAGGGDNVTVQLIRIKSVERMGLYRGRPYRLL